MYPQRDYIHVLVRRTRRPKNDSMRRGKVRARDLLEADRHNLRHELLRSLECIRTKKDFTLFIDLLTQCEQLMLARRIHIAKRLLIGENIHSICSLERTGQATVMAVHRWLKARFADYRDVLPSLYDDLRRREQVARQKAPVMPLTWRWVRRKYPLHFLLFNMILNDLDWGQTEENPRPMPYRPHRRRRTKTGRSSVLLPL